MSNTWLASVAPDGSLTWGVVLGVGMAVTGVTILGVERLACCSSTLLTDLKPTPVGHVMVTSPPHSPTRPHVPTIVMYAKESLLLVCQEDPAGVWPHVEARVDTCNHQQQHGHAHLWDGEGEGLSHSTDSAPATHTEVTNSAHTRVGWTMHNNPRTNLHSTTPLPTCPPQPSPQYPDT